MKCIVCADKNWGIGRDNELLVRIPKDMKMFREETLGKVIVMGRKTLESFPNGLPLEGRENVVLTTKKDYTARDAVIVHSVDELHEVIKDVDPDLVYCIGGGSVYELLLDECDTALVTRLENALDADTYFPNLDKKRNWKMVEESEEQTFFDTIYTFQTWKKV